MGIGKIIPGVSGSMLAITLGIYEDLIDAVTNFFGNTKNNFKLLFNFGIGLFLAIVLFSKVLLFLLNRYYIITMSLILGLILGTVLKFTHQLKFNKKNIFIFILFFSLMLLVSVYSNNITYVFKGNFLSFIYISILGFIDAASSIIPGISGTAIFMMLGSYETVLSIMANPLSILFIIYGVGLIFGIIIICYIMNYLLKHKKEKTYMAIFAFMLSSIVILFLGIKNSFNIFIIILFIMGAIIGYIFDK